MNTSSVSSVSTSSNDLVSFTLPESTFALDTVKRDEIRGLTIEEQQRWASTVTNHTRDLLIILEDSVEAANNNLAAFCMSLNEAISGEAWQILGYTTIQDYVQTEYSLDKLGKNRAVRGQVANVLKTTGGFSNRVIASVMHVSYQTINNDIKQNAVQLTNNLSVAQSSTSGHDKKNDQKSPSKSLGFDGKYRSEKRDEGSKVRDFLEFSFLIDVKHMSYRQVEAVTGVPFKTVDATLGLDHVDNNFHRAVTRKFIQARQYVLAHPHASMGVVATECGLTPDGLEWLLSEQGWLHSRRHEHGTYNPVKSVVACVVFEPSMEYWVKHPYEAAGSLQLNDDAHTPITVSDLGVFIGRKQATVSYHLDMWRKEIAHRLEVDAANVAQKQLLELETARKPRQTHSIATIPLPSETAAQAGISMDTTPEATDVAEHTQSHVDVTSMSSNELMDVQDKGAGWQVVSRDAFYAMASPHRVGVMWDEKVRDQPRTLQMMVSDVESVARSLATGGSTGVEVSKDDAKKFVDMSAAFTKLASTYALLVSRRSEFLTNASLEQKKTLIQRVDECLENLTLLSQALHDPGSVRSISASDSATDTDEDEWDELEDLMGSNW
ncbi:hypothetical protein [Alloscardovia theropitheci]|uniref:hypothetical protein n=1 Tax=Alloscardovia theropitheci TaxID=2496842 RepID=UPI00196B5EEC|nr:hypothetical protein [Alloscardovia theropitheci]